MNTKITENNFYSLLNQELSELESLGLKREISYRDRPNLLNLSSNDYLGLSHDPDVLKKAMGTLSKHGLGGTSSRLLAGTVEPHSELEKKLASFLHKESALVFSSGYHTNTGILPALFGAQDIIFFDKLSHASLIDGIKLSGAHFASYHHNDLSHLKKLLEKKRASARRAVIVTEGIFSMDGDTPPLKDLIGLARDFDCLVYLDEAHSMGLFGPDGRGVAAQENVLSEIDFFIGTLSKTLGSQGGFVAGKKVLMETLVTKCRSFIYTTALAPVCASAAFAALEKFPALQDRRRQLQESAQLLRTNLKSLGYSTLQSTSQIIPVWTGTTETTKKLSKYLLSNGFFVPSIRPPTVPPKEGRVRLSLTYDVIQHGLNDLIAAFKNFPERPEPKGESIV